MPLPMTFTDPATLTGQAFLLLLAVILGGLIGLERQWQGNAAGLRTHILVCVGATLITITSVRISAPVAGGAQFGDPAHLAAQVVSGVGFLGAGAILRDGTTVRGLTTAASIWATAAIGIALGAGPRLAGLAVIAAGIVLGTLTLLARLEKRFGLRSAYRTLRVTAREADGAARVLALLAAENIAVLGVTQEAADAVASTAIPMGASTAGAGTTLHRMAIRVYVPVGFDQTRANTLLAGNAGIAAFEWEG